MLNIRADSILAAGAYAMRRHTSAVTYCRVESPSLSRRHYCAYNFFNNNFKVIPWDGTTWNVVQVQFTFRQRFMSADLNSSLIFVAPFASFFFWHDKYWVAVFSFSVVFFALALSRCLDFW